MNKITQILLGGVAVSALATTAAMAGEPNIHAVALHPGHAKLISKTVIPAGTKGHHISTLNSSIAVSSSIQEQLKTKVALVDTYYTYYDDGSFCNKTEKQKVKLPSRKTAYAKLGTGTETLSGYCSTAPTVFYGDTYDQKKATSSDSFSSILVGKKINFDGTIYNINTTLNVAVSISQ